MAETVGGSPGDDCLVSVVVPAYNEGAALKQLAVELESVFSSVGYRFEVVMVDDGSTDATWSTIAALASDGQRYKGLRLSRNFGKEAAIAAGLDAAAGDVVVVMDADLQHPPEVIAEMLARWESGAVVVDAVKNGRGSQGVIGRLFSRTFNGVFTALTGTALAGATDFKLLDRSAVDEWRRMGEHNTFFRGMSAWLGMPREQVEFAVPPRWAGSTKWRPWGLFRFSIRSLTSFTSAPLHLVTAMGAVFLIGALGLGAHTLVNWYRGAAVEGFTTLILLVLIAGGAIMAGLGIIGEYVASIHDEVKARPRYVTLDRRPRDWTGHRR